MAARNDKISDKQLYLVVSSECAPGRDALGAAGQAVCGGVDIVQMREKTMSPRGLLALGKEFRALCRAKNTIFIVNDDPYIAKEADADGVHMGGKDIAAMPVERVRRLLGPDKLIGLSTHSLDEFESGQEQDVDYLAFGPVFPTKTKDYFIGTKDIKPVLRAAKKPVFFIGGIDLSNLGVLLDMGVKNIALIRGILEAPDIAAQTRAFKEKLSAAKKG